jgi:hypothetical protein
MMMRNFGTQSTLLMMIIRLLPLLLGRPITRTSMLMIAIPHLMILGTGTFCIGVTFI